MSLKGKACIRNNVYIIYNGGGEGANTFAEYCHLKFTWL